jgi:hypothetical protein
LKLDHLILSQRSSPQQAAGYLERNCAEALRAFALTSYGAIASPFLSAASCGVSWRRRMNNDELVKSQEMMFPVIPANPGPRSGIRRGDGLDDFLRDHQQ